MKMCSVCKVIKDNDHFHKRSDTIDGLRANCKDCRKLQQLDYQRTKGGVLTEIYKDQKKNSNARGHRPPEYTKLELKQWLFSQTVFHTMFNEWVLSNYLTELKPSIDRKNDDVHYCFNNIQLMTWKDNRAKSSIDRYSGVDNRNNSAVTKCTLGGSTICEYYSMSKASRDTGITIQAISMAVSGVNKTAGGFTWVSKLSQ